MCGVIIVICILVWLVQANGANARASSDALGPDPVVIETISVAQPVHELSARLLYSGDRKHLVESISSADAILFSAWS